MLMHARKFDELEEEAKRLRESEAKYKADAFKLRDHNVKVRAWCVCKDVKGG
jgi:hypothetical protein